MAFRASQKRPSVKKQESAPSAPEQSDVMQPDVPVHLSVEDIVGGPVADQPAASQPETSPEAFTAPDPQASVPAAAPEMRQQPEQRQPQSQSARPQEQRMGGGNPRHQQGSHRQFGRPQFGGSHNGGYRGGRGRDNFGGQQRFNARPQRERDFAPVEGGAGYTQDINVPTETVKGILDVMPEGHGFLRPKFTPSDRDVYISQSQIRRFLLRNGDEVEGQARAPKENERYYGLLKVEKINNITADGMAPRAKFEDLVPVYPNTALKLETGVTPLSTRIIDLMAPIGFGQRGLIVSPPKAGKTTMLKEIAAGVSANYPDAYLIAALIGERPEEVTDLTRSIKGEVLASNFDESPADQVRVAEVALDRAKRMVELGKDVVVLLDSITRLARAYNMVVNPSGRTLSGGFDPAALYPAKKFLGAARCVEPAVAQPSTVAPGAGGTEAPAAVVEETKRYTTGGSLTVIGTALVETGSRMDDLIYEEFKGTGNMELHLSRSLQERRVFPAIDISKSGTRHDELLLGEDKMKKVTTLRHMLTLLSEDEQTSMTIDKLGKTKSNDEFLESLNKG